MRDPLNRLKLFIFSVIQACCSRTYYSIWTCFFLLFNVQRSWSPRKLNKKRRGVAVCRVSQAGEFIAHVSDIYSMQRVCLVFSRGGLDFETVNHDPFVWCARTVRYLQFANVTGCLSRRDTIGWYKIARSLLYQLSHVFVCLFASICWFEYELACELANVRHFLHYFCR